LGIVAGGKKDIKSLDDYAISSLEENLAIIAVDSKTDELLGISINGTARKEYKDVPIEEKVDEVECEDFKHIIKVMHDLNLK